MRMAANFRNEYDLTVILFFANIRLAMNGKKDRYIPILDFSKYPFKLQFFIIWQALSSDYK